MRAKAKAPPFVMIRQDLLKDPEWRKLSSSAQITYIYLRRKFNYKTLSNVSLSYKEMSDMLCARTLSKAFRDLQKAGFIQKIKQGGLFGGVCVYEFIGPYKDFYYKGQRV